MTLVVMPDECQSIPITAPSDWNQNGCESRRSTSSRPYSSTIASTITRPSRAIRVDSHGGTRPPWSGRSAVPVREARRARARLGSRRSCRPPVAPATPLPPGGAPRAGPGCASYGHAPPRPFDRPARDGRRHRRPARPRAPDAPRAARRRGRLPRLPALGARHADGVRGRAAARRGDARRRAARATTRTSTGAPFVGPAGRLLDRALAAAGIDRRRAYVTNVVKHFKWEAARQATHPPEAGAGEIARLPPLARRRDRGRAAARPSSASARPPRRRSSAARSG